MRDTKRKAQNGAFIIGVVSTPSEIPATKRLARLLKTLLRAYGFRCIDLREGTFDEWDDSIRRQLLQSLQESESEPTA